MHGSTGTRPVSCCYSCVAPPGNMAKASITALAASMCTPSTINIYMQPNYFSSTAIGQLLSVHQFVDLALMSQMPYLSQSNKRYILSLKKKDGNGSCASMKTLSYKGCIFACVTLLLSQSSLRWSVMPQVHINYCFQCGFGTSGTVHVLDRYYLWLQLLLCRRGVCPHHYIIVKGNYSFNPSSVTVKTTLAMP